MSDLFSITPTDDGSCSLYSREFDETMHTSFGAYEEALVKYVNASEAKDRLLHKGSIRVLDVGFGIGYNLLALLQETKGCGVVQAISLEKDRSAHEYIKKICFNDNRDFFFDKIKHAYFESTYSDEHCSINCIFGDARQTVTALISRGAQFDIVFQDPFSPSKNPEMWSREYMKSIATLMKDDAILTTYSAAPQVGRAMLEAGLTVGKGPSTGVKRESTVASKCRDQLKNVLSEDDIHKIIIDPKSCMYSDPQLSDSRETMLARRIDEIKKIRAGHQAPRG